MTMGVGDFLLTGGDVPSDAFSESATVLNGDGLVALPHLTGGGLEIPDPADQIVGALARFVQILNGPATQLTARRGSRVAEGAEESDPALAHPVVLGPSARRPQIDDPKARQERPTGPAGEAASVVGL